MHLIVEGRGGNWHKLISVETGVNFLNNLVEEIDMTKIIEPIVLKYTGSNLEHWGITGLIAIAESHISFHTFPEYKEASIDVFSCKEFTLDKTLDFIKKTFDFEEIEYVVIERGLEFREKNQMNIANHSVSPLSNIPSSIPCNNS